MLRIIAMCAVLLTTTFANASSVLDFDTALTLEPQHIEFGGSFAAGDQQWVVGAKARLGLQPGLDAHIALAGLVLDGDVGFEFGFGPRYQLLQTAETAGFVDVATALDVSVGLAGPQMIVALDPKVLVSRSIRYSKDRAFFFGVTGGTALSLQSVSGGQNVNHLGLLGAITLGLDLTKTLRFSFDIAIRDEVKRVGAGLVTYF